MWNQFINIFSATEDGLVLPYSLGPELSGCTHFRLHGDQFNRLEKPVDEVYNRVQEEQTSCFTLSCTLFQSRYSGSIKKIKC